MVDVSLRSNVQTLASVARFRPQAVVDNTSGREPLGATVDVLGMPLLAMRQGEAIDALV